MQIRGRGTPWLRTIRAKEFLHLMGSGADATELARLFSEQVEWEIAGDTGALPWDREKIRQGRNYRLRDRARGRQL